MNYSTKLLILFLSIQIPMLGHCVRSNIPTIIRSSNLQSVGGSRRLLISITRQPIKNFHLSSSRRFTSAAEPNSDRLSWDEFLRLRRQRRLTGVIASIPTSMLGIYGGVLYFGSGEIDPTQTILGFDPFIMNAAFVLGCGILGWLAGPTIGRGAWHLLHQRKTHLIQEVSPMALQNI